MTTQFKKTKTGEKIKYHFGWLDKYMRDKNSVYPITMQIDPSNLCPLNCEFCSWRSLLHSRPLMLSKDVLLSVVEQCVELGVKAITWTGGGEPLANPATLDAIVAAHKAGIENGLFTNAIYLNEQTAKVFTDSLKWIRFNIGGDNIDNYASVHSVSGKVFKKVCSNVKYFLEIYERRFDSGIGVVINQKNFSLIKNMPKLAKDLGVAFFQAKPDFSQIKDPSFGEWWLNTVEQHFLQIADGLSDSSFKIVVTPVDREPHLAQYCHAHHVTTAVTATGDVAFCNFFRNQKESYIGNVNKSSLQEIFKGSKAKHVKQSMKPQKCSEEGYCPYIEINNYLHNLELELKGAEDFHINFM